MKDSQYLNDGSRSTNRLLSHMSKRGSGSVLKDVPDQAVPELQILDTSSGLLSAVLVSFRTSCIAAAQPFFYLRGHGAIFSTLTSL